MKLSHIFFALVFCVLSSVSARAESANRIVPIDYLKKRDVTGLALESTVEIIVDKTARKGSGKVRGRFTRPGWKLLGRTKQASEVLLANERGKFELAVPLARKLAISFTLVAKNLATAEEESESFTLYYQKGRYTEIPRRERSPFVGSFFKLGPLFSFFTISAVDPVNLGEASFVSSLNIGLRLDITPLAGAFSPRLLFDAVKISIPPSGSRTIVDNSPWVGSAFLGALWWPGTSRSFGLQFGMGAIRQPFVLAADADTLNVSTMDIFRPEISFVLALADSPTISAHVQAGGRLPLPRSTASLTVQSGYEAFLNLQTANTLAAPGPLGISQIFSEFGISRRVYRTNIVDHLIQELSLQIGVGW